MVWSYIFTVCLLIWLMTTKIFILIILIYGNNNVCLGIYVVGFMSIVTFKKIFLSMKRGIWEFVWTLILLKVIVITKRQHLRVFMRIDTFQNYF